MAIAAIGQICSTPDISHNLEQCLKLVKEAAQAGAKVGYDPLPNGHWAATKDVSASQARVDKVLYIKPDRMEAKMECLRVEEVPSVRSKAYGFPALQAIFFPEAADYIASSPHESLSLARPESESPFVLGLQAAAKEHDIHITAGIHVPVPAGPPPSPPGPAAAAAAAAAKLLNRTIWVLPTGEVDPSRSYDKLHLFDYGSLRESAHTRAGAGLAPPFETPVGRVGSLICFDLRFPEAAAALAQPPDRRQPAQVLVYPSAFTVPTGAAHWETLLRARAIEAQCWVVAAAQVGWHSGTAGEGRVSYGGSMVVDPWGRVKCALPAVEERDGEVSVPDGAVGALGLVDIDLGVWESVRERMPLVRRR